MDRFDYNRFYHLIPAQKHYAWGSENKIQSLTGISFPSTSIYDIPLGWLPIQISARGFPSGLIPVRDWILFSEPQA